MKNKVKQSIALILVFALSLSCASAVVVEQDAVQPRYMNIDRFYATLRISEAGEADMESRVELADSNSCRAELKMTLEEKSDGNTWTPIFTWTGSGQVAVTLDEVRYVYRGSLYRVKAEVRVYNANNILIETASTFSGEVNY